MNRAQTAILEGRVYLIDERLSIWLVDGEHADHIVVAGLYCSCPWFVTRFLPGHTDRVCYHLLAVEIARKEGAYKVVEAEEWDKHRIIVEVLATGRSSVLRKLELEGRVKRHTH